MKSNEELRSKYDYVGEFVNGLAIVRLNGKCGFINERGKEITPLKYDLAWKFKNGFAMVRLNGKYFYINEKGEKVENHKAKL